MTGPRVLNLVRPYRTELEYVENEGWTIERRSIVLIGAPSLEVGEHLRFSIMLANGQRIVRAEGQVLGPREASEGRPPGVRVKFRRFDLATKELVERLDAQRGSYEMESSPTSIGADIPPSIVVAPPSREIHSASGEDATPVRADGRTQSVSADRRCALPPPSTREPPTKSTPRAKVPLDRRDELLERLRERVRR